MTHVVDALALCVVLALMWWAWRTRHYRPSKPAPWWWPIVLGVGIAALLLGLRDIAHVFDMLVELFVL